MFLEEDALFSKEHLALQEMESWGEYGWPTCHRCFIDYGLFAGEQQVVLMASTSLKNHANWWAHRGCFGMGSTSCILGSGLWSGAAVSSWASGDVFVWGLLPSRLSAGTKGESSGEEHHPAGLPVPTMQQDKHMGCFLFQRTVCFIGVCRAGTRTNSLPLKSQAACCKGHPVTYRKWTRINSLSTRLYFPAGQRKASALLSEGSCLPWDVWGFIWLQLSSLARLVSSPTSASSPTSCLAPPASGCGAQRLQKTICCSLSSDEDCAGCVISDWFIPVFSLWEMNLLKASHFSMNYWEPA